VERLKTFKAHRDADVVQRWLEGIRECARGTDNLMPVLREALKDGCSMGEVCGAVRDVFGEYKPTF
jgi:methylmalonyl-CoA mutase N-terminal domain/subunit